MRRGNRYSAIVIRYALCQWTYIVDHIYEWIRSARKDQSIAHYHPPITDYRLPVTTYFLPLTTYLSLLFLAPSCDSQQKVTQITIDRIALMPDQPEPYKMTDWYEKAHHFDQYVFNLELKEEHQPFIWIDSAQRNFPQNTFGMFTVIGDIRQGPKGSREFHEALCSMGSVLGAGLVGIDKANQNGFNYVKMTQNYFNAANG